VVSVPGASPPFPVIDATGVFGLPLNTSLDGYAFTLVYTFDTTYTYGSNQLVGGSGLGFPPEGSATLEINDVTQAFSGSDYDLYSTTNTGYVDETHQQVQGSVQSPDGTLVDSVGMVVDGGNFPTSIYTPFSQDVTAGLAGSFQIELLPTGSNVYSILAEGGLSPTHIDVTVSPSVVPLPAALPLFASGLGVMGWMARRKRQKSITQAVG
jgi:hypothetical protein